MTDPIAQHHECDLLVIGGGINGAGIARDAAGRGLSVVLCERDDLAQHTSSASTKLVHGGLRYLEQYQFKLVRKALREREVLLRIAPHLISPLRFILPRMAGSRPAWMIRAGLFLYDHLARRELLPASCAVDLAQDVAGPALKGELRQAFAYHDAWVDDARLVLLNARDAHERGARILTGTSCTALLPSGAQWKATLAGRHACTVHARSVVNAAGPWAAALAHLAEAGQPGAPGRKVRLVKGSHIVVPRLFSHPHAYLFQQADGRVVFAIAYQDDFTLIGTTDLAYQGDPARVAIDDAEVAYLCAAVNQYFRKQIGRRDVVWSYSGVRPLLDDGVDNPSAVTRDYLLEWSAGTPPLLNVWGGKITTYRTLAEQALDMLCLRLVHAHGGWTAGAALPGGDLTGAPAAVDTIQADSFARFQRALEQRYRWMPRSLLGRYARSYGTRIAQLVGAAQSMAGLGEQLAPGLYEAEARYLVEQEWVHCAADLLWRRTKLGLRCSEDDVARVEQWLAGRVDAAALC